LQPEINKKFDMTISMFTAWWWRNSRFKKSWVVKACVYIKYQYHQGLSFLRQAFFVLVVSTINLIQSKLMMRIIQ